uniref:AGC-kinase C-terminal domain-containing protein n=1 Tax=Macrostomum lignano TaxID=282301 RepID=A0A1I8FR35_9PLAT
VKGVHLDDKDQDFYSRFNTGAHPVPGGDDRDECFADLEVYYSASGGLVDSLNPDLPAASPRKACFRSFSAAASGTAEPALPAPLARASQRPDWFNRTRPARKAILLPLERKRKPAYQRLLAASIPSQQQSGSRW